MTIPALSGRLDIGLVELGNPMDKLVKWLTQPFLEDINIPVKVGDTILTGRFKNKKTVVKTIGKDEYGMPTINGRKVVNFRLVKEGFDVDLEDVEFPSDMPQDENTLKAAIPFKNSKLGITILVGKKEKIK